MPPVNTAKVKPLSFTNRDRTLLWIKAVGRQQWKRTSGYNYQARVENTFFRYKQIVGGRLRSRRFDAQVVETTMACNILNRMTELGRPESIAISR